MRTSISLFVSLVLLAFVCQATADNATTEDEHHDEHDHDDDHNDENTTPEDHDDHGDHDHDHDDDHHDEKNDGAGTSSAPMMFLGSVAITAAYGFLM